MTPEKLARIERAGFHVGTIQQLLGLTDAEMAEVEAAVESFITEAEDDAQPEMDLLLIKDLYGDD